MKNPSTLPGDSHDYRLIKHAIENIPGDVCGMTCEIGLRQGGGTRHIIDALSVKDTLYKVHVAIDPYGNILYSRKEGVIKKMNYTNQMRDSSLGHIYTYAMNKQVNFVFINLEDEEFFKRYADGVPVYNEEKHLLNQYMFVHFDGPHDTESVLKEFVWFDSRMPHGATIVFDDVHTYNHYFIEDQLVDCGWELLKKTKYKASYQKQANT